MGVGDAFHAAESRIYKDNTHADDHTGGYLHFQETGKDDANAPHLPGDIGERNKNQTDNSNHPGCLGVIALTDEIGNGELTKLAQVGRKQQGQKNVTAGPAQQIDRAVAAHERNNSRHGNERGGAHPIRCRRHAVDHWIDTAASDIKISG